MCSRSLPSTLEITKGGEAGESHNNSLASRLHTNTWQGSSSACPVRLLYSRSCARTLMTDDCAIHLLWMHVGVHL